MTERSLQPTRPWTLGPWQVERRVEKDRERDGVVEAIGPEVIEPLVADYGGDWWLDVSGADADLITLAPDMAELILAHTDGWQADKHPEHFDAHELRLFALGEKLRAIGDDHA